LDRSPLGDTVRCGYVLDRQPGNIKFLVIDNRLCHDAPFEYEYEYRLPPEYEYEESEA
jgi:hypothetical protein